MENVYLQPFGENQNTKYPLNEIRYRSDDGIVLEVANNLKKMNADEIFALKETFDKRAGSWNPLDRSGVWRYREFLPSFAPFDTVVTMPEGNTPIYDMPQSAVYAGMNSLMAKHQGANPTGSFKDNGMTTAVTMAKKLGASMVACASTGNTSASMAAYAARAGMKSIVFIPEGQIAYGKLSQALDYGGLTIQLSGDFDKAMEIVEEVCNRGNIYLLNSINPFRIEGQKTIMIEMLHQLDWESPDWVIVPGGNLGNNSAFGKAFKEMVDSGFINKIPKVAVIQACGANPLYQSYEKGERVLHPMHANTRATAIKIGNPVSFDKSWFTIDYTKGVVEQVTEQEIALAKSKVGVDGVGSEPASATTIAGCKKLVEKGIIKPSEKVVCILTGHLLKDPDYTVEFHTDELYEEVNRTSNLTGTKKLSTQGYRNSPVQMDADANKILEFIRSRKFEI